MRHVAHTHAQMPTGQKKVLDPPLAGGCEPLRRVLGAGLGSSGGRVSALNRRAASPALSKPKQMLTFGPLPWVASLQEPVRAAAGSRVRFVGVVCVCLDILSTWLGSFS